MPHRCGFLKRLAALLLLGASASASASVVPAAAAAATAQPVALVQALRLGPSGPPQPVTLPDQAPVAVRAAHTLAPPPVTQLVYRLDAPALPDDAVPQALYLPGLAWPARVSVDGRVVHDRLDTVAPARANGAAAQVLVDLPRDVARGRPLALEIALAGRTGLGLPAVWLGPRAVLQQRRDARAFLVTTAPLLVATVIGCLGLGVLVLYARQRSEPTYIYFGVGALLWAVHDAWDVLPLPQTGLHLSVWWHTVQAMFVSMLVIFSMRFVGRSQRAFERLLLWVCAALPPVLYAAGWLGQLPPTVRALRLGLVGVSMAGLVAVVRHAWQARTVSAALLTLAALAGTGLGLRDWIVFRRGSSPDLVELTPFAGLPFIAVVSWMLLDRYVRAGAALQTMNARLEQRVAEREAQLAASFDELAELQRQQATDDERQRIMRDLHDGLGSQLLVSLSRAERGALQGAATVEALRSAIEEMRLAIDALDGHGQEVGAAFGSFRQRWQPRLNDAGVRSTWVLDLTEPATPADGAAPLSPHGVLQLLRIAQEALTNVLKHARASCVEVALRVQADALVLSVDDDGTGLAESGPETGSGRGLANMRQRARRLGATLTVATRPSGHGTGVRVHVPLQHAQMQT